MSQETLSAFHRKRKNEVAPYVGTHERIWRECLRVQGEGKRKFEKEEEDGESKDLGMGRRRLVSLFEANEVARRLAGSQNLRGNGAGVKSDVVSKWL